MPVKAKKRKPAKKKKRGQRGGNGLPGFGAFMNDQLKATGWASQTAQNFSGLPFQPTGTQLFGVVSADILRKMGY